MVHNFASVIALAIHALSHATVGDDCSVEKTCNCFQVDGKPSARCNANLTRIPKFHASFRLKRLELDKNQFGVLSRKYFSDVGSWPMLQELSLKDCRIERLETEAFYGLVNLRILYLSRNLLTTISNYDVKSKVNLHGFFDELTHLKELDLSHNQLTELKGSPFRLNYQLQILDLSDNRLETLSVRAFDGPKSLHTIRLVGNKFHRLFLEPFRGLDHLRTLNVQGNPFYCDCHLRPFFMYTEKYRFSRGTSCEKPGRLDGRVWQDIKPHEFACHVEMLFAKKRNEKYTRRKHYAPAATVTFQCGAQGDPRPNISWELAQNGSRIALTKLIKSQPDRISLKSVSYGRDKFGHPAVDTTLTIKSIGTADTGRYHCVADNLHTDAYEVYDLFLKSKDSILPAPSSSLPPPSHWLMVATGVAIALLVLALIATIFVCARKRRSRPAPVYTHMNGNGYKYISAGGGAHLTDHAGNGGTPVAVGSTNVTPPATNGSSKHPEKPARTFDFTPSDNAPPAWMEPVHVAALDKQNGPGSRHGTLGRNGGPKSISCYPAQPYGSHNGGSTPHGVTTNGGIIAVGPNQPIIVADTRAGRGIVPPSNLDEVTYLPVMDGPQDGDSGYLEGVTPPIPPPTFVVASSNNPATCALTHQRRHNGGMAVGPPPPGVHLYSDTAPLARSEVTPENRIPLRETSL